MVKGPLERFSFLNCRGVEWRTRATTPQRHLWYYTAPILAMVTAVNTFISFL